MTSIVSEIDKNIELKTPRKSVTFHSSMKLVLIPCIRDYSDAGLLHVLWWTTSDFFNFQQSAHSEIRQLAAFESVSHADARKKLYQPTHSEIRSAPSSTILNNVESSHSPDSSNSGSIPSYEEWGNAISRNKTLTRTHPGVDEEEEDDMIPSPTSITYRHKSTSYTPSSNTTTTTQQAESDASPQSAPSRPIVLASKSYIFNRSTDNLRNLQTNNDKGASPTPLKHRNYSDIKEEPSWLRCAIVPDIPLPEDKVGRSSSRSNKSSKNLWDAGMTFLSSSLVGWTSIAAVVALYIVPLIDQSEK